MHATPWRALPELQYGVLALFTVAVGLVLHFYGQGLPPDARDILGDALWASMLYWLVCAVAPSAPKQWRILAALVGCFAIELTQLVDTKTLASIRSTTIGHLVLGSDFDVRDLIAYGVGVAGAARVDLWRTGTSADLNHEQRRSA